MLRKAAPLAPGLQGHTGHGPQLNERPKSFSVSQLHAVVIVSNSDNTRGVCSKWTSVFEVTYWCAGKAAFNITGAYVGDSK